MNAQTVPADNKDYSRPYRKIKQIIIFFCILEMLDALITYFAVNAGLVLEGNQLIAHIAGSWIFVLIKIIGAILSGFIIKILYDYFPKSSLATAISIAAFYGIVLAWNASMIINNLIAL